MKNKPEHIIWNNVEHPIGCVVIIPSVDESIEKYTDFANFLNRGGYIAYGIGNTSVDDAYTDILNTELDAIKKRYALPLFLVGCGYGTIIMYNIQNRSAVARACVSVPNMRAIGFSKLVAMRILVWMGKNIFGPDTYASGIGKRLHIDNITYQKCGTVIRQLMRHANQIQSKTPTLVINGGDISYTDGQLARMLYNIYSHHDMNNLTLMIYPDAGNAPLFDPMRDTVHTDIMDFLGQENHQRI